jgi:protein tyrosine phosphatase (PTP) superfamily phosphohydrolase (DUF442 family)
MAKCLTLLVMCLASFGSAQSKDYSGSAGPTFHWGPAPHVEDLAELKSRGIKCLINIRTNPLRKVQEAAEEMGFKYYQIKTGVFRTPKTDAIAEFIKLVSDPSNQPTYIFCKGGRDRTAFYVSVYQMAFQNKTADQICQEPEMRGIRMWWPTFRLYNRRLHAHEDEIKKLAGVTPNKHNLVHCTARHHHTP